MFMSAYTDIARYSRNKFCIMADMLNETSHF